MWFLQHCVRGYDKYPTTARKKTEYYSKGVRHTMKVRNGFVSNSSTSSFFIVMKRDQFDRCVEKDGDITKEVAEEHVWSTQFLGEDVVIVENLFMMDGTAYDWPEEMWELYNTLKNEPETLKGGISE